MKTSFYLQCLYSTFFKYYCYFWCLSVTLSYRYWCGDIYTIKGHGLFSFLQPLPTLVFLSLLRCNVLLIFFYH